MGGRGGGGVAALFWAAVMAASAAVWIAAALVASIPACLSASGEGGEKTQPAQLESNHALTRVEMIKMGRFITNECD
jgi:hypothetical protein